MIDTSHIKKATNDNALATTLMTEKAIAYMSIACSLISAMLLVYVSYGTERLELVYLDKDRLDAPTFLSKVNTDDNPIKADRWTRGFVNRFIRYYFIHGDDSTTFAKSAYVWMHAHTGSAGRVRSESLHSDFAKYDESRRKKYTAFYPVNDVSSMKIRESKDDNRIIFVEQRGTYNIKVDDVEAFQDATLKLVIQKVPVSGADSGLGGVNATGLIVLDGTIEFVEDPTRPSEVYRQSIFN